MSGAEQAGARCHGARACKDTSMLDDPLFFPYLQPAAWPGRATCLVRELVPPPGDLIITYGLAGSAQNRYLAREALAANEVTEDEVHERAVDNLRKRHGKIPWSTVAIGGEDVLMRSGDPVVSSDVLNPKGMAKLAGFLNVPKVVIGIPSCFTVLAAADGALLSGIVAGLHREAEKERAGALSAKLYELEAGTITRVYSDPDERRVSSASVGDAERAKLIIEGLASVYVVVDRAAGAGNGRSPGNFWDICRKKIGKPTGALGGLEGQTTESFAEAVAKLLDHPRPLAGVRTLAKVARYALADEERARLTQAALAAALAAGQVGTGFFGLGRALPKQLRLPIWGIAGLLGAEVP
jgi:hypothetical protein